MSTTLTQLSPQVILAPIAGRFDAHQVPKVQKEIDAAMAGGAVPTTVATMSAPAVMKRRVRMMSS